MKLEGYRIILASKSPRRKELLCRIADGFEVDAREVDESLPEGCPPSDGVRELALRKGEPVAADNPDAIVISSDTLVELDGVPLGKPEDREDAFRMLSSLSDREHTVATGVAVRYRGRVASGVDVARVRFRHMSVGEIWDYINGGEPMDKAGAYGIQGEGGKFVERYDGGFDTIMGLSLSLVEQLISEVLGGSND